MGREADDDDATRGIEVGDVIWRDPLPDQLSFSSQNEHDDEDEQDDDDDDPTIGLPTGPVIWEEPPEKRRLL